MAETINQNNFNTFAYVFRKYKFGDNLVAIVTALTEAQTKLNALRVDFRAHDHGGTYTAATTRLNASANTFSGTAETSAVANATLPAAVN